MRELIAKDIVFVAGQIIWEFIEGMMMFYTMVD